MSKYLFKRFAILGGTCFGIYEVDKHFYYSTLSRNIYTLYTGLIITLDTKLNFNQENVDGIENIHLRNALRILNCCKHNGGLYIKFGQQIATVPVLPPSYLENLKQLYDQAPVFDFSTVEKIFLNQFGKKPDEIFAEFDPVPIQSASIAQVHKATLKNGDKVAVKIQKPEIKHQIVMDMLCYRVLIWSFEKLFELPLYWSADYIEFHIKQETDFLNEAKNAEKCFKHIQESKLDVYVPKIYHDYTSKEILTAEWIDGYSLKEKQNLISAGYSIKEVMTDVVKVFSDQIFKWGFVHADPHVSNVYVRKHPKKNKHQVVLLDHGLYVQCSPKFSKEYSQFWVSLFSLDTETTKKITQSWGIPDPTMFATATLARPWRAGKPLHLNQKPTFKDVYQSHLEAKDRIRTFLSDTDKLPKELIFVGRNLNCIRANNKNLGSPVNRINLMANDAAKCLAEREPNYLSNIYLKFKFRFSLFVITLLNVWADLRYSWSRSGGMEDLLDQSIKERLQKEFPGMNLDIDRAFE